MNLNEELEKIKGLIFELSPKSTGVKEFIEDVEKNKELLKHLGFTSIKSLKDYIESADFDDFDELRKDAKKFFKKNSK